MAQIFAASIYGINGQSTGGAAGTTFGFATQSVLIRPAPASTTFNGVTMNSIVQMLPAGTQVQNSQYFSAASVATLISAANA